MKRAVIQPMNGLMELRQRGGATCVGSTALY